MINRGLAVAETNRSLSAAKPALASTCVTSFPLHALEKEPYVAFIRRNHIIRAPQHQLEGSEFVCTADDTTTSYEVQATTAQEALLDPISGGGFDHWDVTQLNITFNMQPGFGNVFFNVVFGSEEYDEFVGSDFVDAFGLYLNNVNIASVGGMPVNINHPDMAVIAGTELDGILAPDGNPVLLFSGTVTPGSSGNTLTFIVADTSDDQLDTTVYISQLGGTPPTQEPPPTGVPEPGSLVLLGAGLSSLIFTRRRAALQRA